jgi:DNA-binding NtrC family response regulator
MFNFPPAQSVVTMSRRVLSVGRDEVALQTRNEILRRAGYEVVSALRVSSEQLLASVDDTVDCVLFGQSIPGDERENLARAVRARYPSKLVVVLHPSNEEGGAAWATVSLNSMDGPKAMLDAIQSAG